MLTDWILQNSVDYTQIYSYFNIALSKYMCKFLLHRLQPGSWIYSKSKTKVLNSPSGIAWPSMLSICSIAGKPQRSRSVDAIKSQQMFHFVHVSCQNHNAVTENAHNHLRDLRIQLSIKLNAEISTSRVWAALSKSFYILKIKLICLKYHGKEVAND